MPQDRAEPAGGRAADGEDQLRARLVLHVLDLVELAVEIAGVSGIAEAVEADDLHARGHAGEAHSDVAHFAVELRGGGGAEPTGPGSLLEREPEAPSERRVPEPVAGERHPRSPGDTESGGIPERAPRSDATAHVGRRRHRDAWLARRQDPRTAVYVP